MGKKDRNENDPAPRKGKRGKEPFTFLGTRFDSITSETVRNHLLLLVIATIATKFIVIIATTFFFSSFIDLFDIGIYLKHASRLLQGQIPYIDYQIEYPVLTFLPILLAFIPAFLFNNIMVFVYSFQILMVICDILIVICVYLIGLKVWNEKLAFHAGLIYATAFATAYFIITKADAFSTLLLMLAILFTVYGMNARGYFFGTLGFFTKIFPVIALPFMVLFNARSTTIKEELKSVGLIFLLSGIILLLPFALINPEVLQTYLFATGGSVGVYVNTATFTLYSYLHDILHLNVTAASISLVMYALMGITLIILFCIAVADKEKNPVTLMKLVLCALFSLIFFTKFHSPQYIVWFTPLLALLVSDSLQKTVLFYIVQILAYIEFPLMFGTYYVNLEYLNPIGSFGWYLTLIFFTLQYLTLIILVLLIVLTNSGSRQKNRDHTTE